MTANEAYARTAESESMDINFLFSGWGTHLNEISDASYLDDGVNQRVKVKILKDFNFDGRRFWRMCTIWFDDKPVMITQNAGREGTDHVSRFITDEPLYKEMVTYIKSLMPPLFNLNDDIVSPDEDIKLIGNFYDNSLDGFFERYKY